MADDQLPEGLSYHEDFITPEEERDLLDTIEALDFRTLTMRGQTAKRTVRHFGLDYEYEMGDLVPADPLPDALVPLRDRAAALIERDQHSIPATKELRYSLTFRTLKRS
jgi:hypothetical protein